MTAWVPSAQAQRMVFATAQAPIPPTSQPRLDPNYLPPPPGSQPLGSQPLVTQPPARLDGSIQGQPLQNPSAPQTFDPYRMQPSQPLYAPSNPFTAPRTQPFAQPYPNPGYPNTAPNAGYPNTGYSQPYPGQPYAGQPYPGQPYPGQQYPGYPPGYQNDVLLRRPSRMNQLHFDYTYMPGTSGADMDINDFNWRASFVFNPFYAQEPLVVTPNFGLHLWGGPQFRDLPGQVYDFSTDIGWRPRFGERFAVDLGVTPGFYADFNGVNSEAFRFQARVVGLLTMSPTTELRFGVVYLDRVSVDWLPVLGVVWTPNDDTRFELVFPRPKLAHRLGASGTSDWWWYVSGEFGGGTWALERPGDAELVDYRDIKLILGLEWQSNNGPHGMFEVGYVFNRELEFNGPTPPFSLDDTLMFRMGFSF